MKLEADLVELTAQVAPSVSVELSKAAALSRKGFFTEAGMRIGRSIEAALYATARALEVEVSHRRISDFTSLADQLWQKEVEIIRKKSGIEVAKLSDVAGQVAKLIYRLAADEDARGGEPTSEPKRTQALLREIATALGGRDAANVAALMKHEPLLEAIQRTRNRAAHASVSGEVQELDQLDLDQLVTDATTVLRGLMNTILGARATARDRPLAT